MYLSHVSSMHSRFQISCVYVVYVSEFIYICIHFIISLALEILSLVVSELLVLWGKW